MDAQWGRIRGCGGGVLARAVLDGSDAIYSMARKWLEVARDGGSLITPGAPVWTPGDLAALHEAFIGQPDLRPKVVYLDKMRGQLAGCSPEAVQLMVEVHVVYYLMIWQGAAKPATKVRDLETMLGWLPEPVGLPADVAAAMGPGLAHPGQWALTRRDVQISWFIRFAESWVALPRARQDQALEDPWTFKELVQPVPSSDNSDFARLATLHLIHPDTFERIVVETDRAAVLKRFDAAGDPAEDPDRRLLKVRQQLTPTYGEYFEYYDPRVFPLWKRDLKKWAEFQYWCDQFHEWHEFDAEERDYKLQAERRLQVLRQAALAGEPEWEQRVLAELKNSEHNLVGFRVNIGVASWLDQAPDGFRLAVLALWSGDHAVEERIRSFDEQVPDGVLPTTGERLQLVAFLLMALGATGHPPMKISSFRKAWSLTGWPAEPSEPGVADTYERIIMFCQELLRESSGWRAPLRDVLDAQSVVWTATKWETKPAPWPDDLWHKHLTWRDGKEADPGPDHDPPDPVPPVPRDGLDAASRDLLIDRRHLDEWIDLLDHRGQIVFYGPPGTGKTYVAKRLARALADGEDDRWQLVQFHPATTYEDFLEGLRPVVDETSGQLAYRRIEGPLVRMAEAARANPDKRHVLVIDELNRANLPKVLGELLFLLEYRDESARLIYRPDEPFELPGNLWIIATMNTADRSIALIDAAMRRRFDFVAFLPETDHLQGLLGRWLAASGEPGGIASFVDDVNRELRGSLGEHLQLGPSFFMRKGLTESAVRRIWTHNVFPFIEDQLWGQEELTEWRWESVRTRFFLKSGDVTLDDEVDGDLSVEEDEPEPTEEFDETSE